MKDKILLVAVNARYTHSNLALRYLRNYIADLDYNCELIEFTIKQFPQDVLKDIYRSKPDIVAVSVYIWNTEICKILLSEIKKVLPNTKIILGGPEVSYNADEWLAQFDSIDWIICGHGEAGFKYLLESGLAVSEKIIKLRNPDFKEILFPYTDKDFPDIQNKYIYYESSRGCPFKCSYCLSSRSDQSLEYKGIKQVKKELTWLIEQKPKIVKFVDRTFNADKNFAREIWRFLIDLNPETKFHFEIHPAVLDDSDFDLLSTSPNELFQFEIGIQSTNPDTIKAINRQQNWAISKKNIQRLISLKKFHIHVDLIVGLPFEDPESLKHSFNEIISLNADHFQMGFLKILPGTEMAESKNQYEMQNFEKAPYQIISNKWLSYKEMEKLHLVENLLESIHNSGKFKTSYSCLLAIYPDPFSLFDSLAEFNETTDFNEIGKGWEKTGKMLLDFTKSVFPEKMELMIDSLCWDWCEIAGSHFYPPFLKPLNSLEWKKIGNKYFQQFKSDRSVRINKLNLSLKSIKKAIFYFPASPDFFRMHSYEKVIYAFVSDNKQKVIIPIPYKS